MNNYICIFTSLFDSTTDLVIDWIKGCSALDVIKITKLALKEPNNEISIEINEEGNALRISNKPIFSVWIRKDFYIGFQNSIDNDKINKHLDNELFELKASAFKFMNIHFNKILGKNKYGFIDDNKIHSLLLAKNAGFLIPNTIVTNKKSDALLFYNKYNKIISKPIFNGSFFESEQTSYGIYTSVIEKSFFSKIGDFFFPSIIQEYIEKAIELRVFFIEELIFCAAIFSQASNQTEIDYRRTDVKRPNRVVPFSLPKEIQDKINLFIHLSTLNTGSIDLIVTPENQIYFLEVNPVGQFDFISRQCNFYIEEKIAKYLTN